MRKREYKIGIELSDKQWKHLAPFLYEPERSGKGGQVPAGNRACLEGIIWLMRSGARYKDIPPHFPSGSTCWRRLYWLYHTGQLKKVWQQLLGQLDAKGRLRLEECMADGTFSSAKKGGARLVLPKKVKAQKS
jgi:transposase